MDIVQYCPQNIQWILLNTIHRIFNGYCSVLSTEYSMDIDQYCPQNIQWILLSTVHRPSRSWDRASLISTCIYDQQDATYIMIFIINNDLFIVFGIAK